ncbi:MAG: ABC transporter substrate-binding protein [Thermofilaceae archaeon]
MRRGVLLAGIVAAIVAAAALAYFFVYLPSQQRGKIKVVVYAYLDRITGIDPSIEDDTGIPVIGVVYETLVRYDPATGDVVPVLAESWEHSEDGKLWTFRLRRGVVFHDGTPFNSTAVKLSIERAKGVYEKFGRGSGYIWSSVEEVEIVDEYTVNIRLSYPARLDLMAAAIYSAYIFSPSALVKAGVESPLDPKLESWFNQGNDAGSGPYYIEYYSPESEVRLRKFERWWGWSLVNNPDAPDVVVIKIMTDPLSQYNGLLAGEVHIASSVPRANVQDLASRGFKVINVTLFHNYLLLFNVRRYPTNITAFRLAVIHAIPWEELVPVALRGFGRVGRGLIPHGFPGYDEQLAYKYDLTLAREYLQESGVPKGTVIEFVYQGEYEENEAFAQLLKSRLAEIGITVELKPLPWTAVRDAGKAVWEDAERAPHLIISDWWPTIPSPYEFLAIFHSTNTEWNWAGYNNTEFDELLDRAYELEGEDYELALRLYAQAHKMLFDEGVAVNLWDEVRPFVVSPRVDLPEGALNPLYIYVIRFELVKVRD